MEQIDLADLKSVRQFADKMNKKLDKLDLLIISDANEYICKNINCIKVIQVITINYLVDLSYIFIFKT